MKDNCKLEEDQLKKISGGWKTETEKVYYFNKGDCFHDDIVNADFKILEDYSRGVGGMFEVRCRYRYNIYYQIVENNLKAGLFDDFTFKGNNFYTDL